MLIPCWSRICYQ